MNKYQLLVDKLITDGNYEWKRIANDDFPINILDELQSLGIEVKESYSTFQSSHEIIISRILENVTDPFGEVYTQNSSFILLLIPNRTLKSNEILNFSLVRSNQVGITDNPFEDIFTLSDLFTRAKEKEMNLDQLFKDFELF